MKPTIAFRAITPADYADFIRATGYLPGPQFGGIVAFHDDVLMGAVGLDNWTHTTVSAHWWIRHPRCILPLWNEVTTYLAQHHWKKVIGYTPGDNVRALRMIFGRLHFHEVARLKDGWDDGVDIVISEYHIHARSTTTAGLRRSTPTENTGRTPTERAGDADDTGRIAGRRSAAERA